MMASIQSCGSSNGEVDNEFLIPDSEATFANPVDASTLRSALITGTTPGDDDQFWQCTTTADDQVLAYRLYADGAGTETVMASPSVNSTFTWQTTSATSMTSTPSSGGQNNFSDIQFSGGDNMSLLLADSLMVSCDRQSGEQQTPTLTVPPAGDNALSYGGSISPLTHGFEEAFDFRPTSLSDPTVTLDTHSTSQFQVADASFRQTTIFLAGGSPLILWRPNNATVWLRADLHSPGGDGFENVSFQYRPDSIEENGPEVAGNYFFNEGRFGVDIDGDGDIDSDANEFIDVTNGTISVTRTGDARASMSFTLTLANGVTLTGSFEGVFPRFDP